MPSAAPPPSRPAWRACVLPLGLALAAILPYLRALPNPFVYDDVRTVVTNASLTDLSDLRRILWHDVKRPLVNLSYAIDHAAWGLGPVGFHLTNAVLHAGAVVLLFLWTRRLVEDTAGGQPVHLCARCAAGAAALVFAVHPAMTQAVGYVSGRPEVLCAVGFLAGLLLLRLYVLHGGRLALALGGLAWAAALASKEVGAMLPLALGAWAIAAGLKAPAARRRVAVLLACLVAASLAAGVSRVLLLWLVEHPRETTVVWSHLLVMPEVVTRYLRLLVFPAGQSVFHAVGAIDSPWSARMVGPFAVVAVLTWIAWRLRRTEPVMGFGLAWFALLIVPSSALFVVNLGEPMAEQRIYLAGCGVFMVAGVASARVREWLRVRAPRFALAAPASVALVAAILFVLTVVRLEAWRSPVRLWADAERKAPGAWVPPLMLGDALDAEGRTRDAVEAYRRAAALRGEQPMTWLKLGTALMAAGDAPAATRAFEAALALDPGSAAAQNALGAVAMAGGRPDDARQRFEAALAADASNVTARQLLAALDEQAGRSADALRRCTEIEALAPGTPGVRECIERTRGSDGRER
jgi:cytochrome c-type biogenesis protein CcmH/NrfG